MDPLDNLLTTHPIPTGWEISLKPYANWQFGCIDNPDCPFGEGSGATQTWAQSDGPELLLTLLGGVVGRIFGTYMGAFSQPNWKSVM